MYTHTRCACAATEAAGQELRKQIEEKAAGPVTDVFNSVGSASTPTGPMLEQSMETLHKVTFLVGG